MAKIINQCITGFVIASLILISSGNIARSEEYSSEEKVEVGEMTYDALLLRPLGTVATIVGMGIFIVSLPFSAAFDGGIRTVFDKMVVDPAKYTFKRPLGKF